jgi:hypothetical protein
VPPPIDVAIYAPMTYTSLCVMLLMRAASITRASGRGLGPGNRDFFGPCEMASSRKVRVILGPKKSRFPGPNPRPLAQVMDAARIKSITHRDV